MGKNFVVQLASHVVFEAVEICGNYTRTALQLDKDGGTALHQYAGGGGYMW